MSSAIPNRLVHLWIFHLFFFGTYLMQGLLQMAVSCICQISMQLLWGMMIFCLALGCDKQKWHLYEQDIVHYLVLVKLRISPLWTGLNDAWLQLTRSRHNLTFPLSFSTNTKLLYHSAVSSTPNGVMMFCCWSCLNLSLNGFCRE